MGNETVVERWRTHLTHLPPTIVDSTGRCHKIRYVRMLVTANRVPRSLLSAPLTDDAAERVRRQRKDFLTAHEAFVNHYVADDSCACIVNASISASNSAHAATSVSDRACELVSFVGRATGAPFVLDAAQQCENIVADCHTDVPKICEWCPTVGIFIGNLNIARCGAE